MFTGYKEKIIYLLQSIFSEQNIYYIKAYLTEIFLVVLAFIAPIETWIVLIEFFVFAEYLTMRMVKDKKPTKKFTWFLIKAFLFVIALSQARALEGAFFPQVPIAQYVAAGILIYQFQLTLKNISEYAGVNLWEGITEELHRILTEMIKSKNKLK